MSPVSAALPRRRRHDRCPGVLRPWVAEDGALLRIRLVGGLLRRDQLAGLRDLAVRYGDGDLHLTSRANVQVRGVPLPVPESVADEVTALGLLPSRSHERVRNIMVSPLTGRVGGLVDLRAAAWALDAAVRDEACLADLPARFLFCLDDRGDLQARDADLAGVALGPSCLRLWAGGMPGEVVHVADAPRRMVDLAQTFMAVRGSGPTAPWHVSELPGGGADLGPFQPAPATAATDVSTPGPPAYGPLAQHDGRAAHHLAVPDGTLTPALMEAVLAEAADEVVVTPWRSLILPDLEADA
jgi:precorrin-3B synthase